MDGFRRARQAGVRSSPEALLAAIPYCRHLGMTARADGERLTLIMPFAPNLTGNPAIPALHGGVIGSFLETAAIAQVLWELGGEFRPKPVGITIDYLRTGRATESYARGRLVRQGRRMVNVLAEMWQDDETKPVAALRGHFLLATVRPQSASPQS